MAPRSAFTSRVKTILRKAGRRGSWLPRRNRSGYALCFPDWYASPDQGATWSIKSVHLGGAEISEDELARHLRRRSAQNLRLADAKAAVTAVEVSAGRMVKKMIVGW